MVFDDKYMRNEVRPSLRLTQKQEMSIAIAIVCIVICKNARAK